MTPEMRARIRLYLDRRQPLPFEIAEELWEAFEAEERRGEKALAKRRRYLERRSAKVAAIPPSEAQP